LPVGNNQPYRTRTSTPHHSCNDALPSFPCPATKSRPLAAHCRATPSVTDHVIVVLVPGPERQEPAVGAVHPATALALILPEQSSDLSQSVCGKPIIIQGRLWAHAQATAFHDACDRRRHRRCLRLIIISGPSETWFGGYRHVQNCTWCNHPEMPSSPTTQANHTQATSLSRPNTFPSVSPPKLETSQPPRFPPQANNILDSADMSVSHASSSCPLKNSI
jgi:hypothetical protein